MLGAYEPADVGWLSLLPPLVTMILALATKEVIISLLMGIILAATIYVVKTHRGIVDIVQVLFDILGSRVSSNMYMCLFMFLMGSLVQLMSKAGGTRAFGEWSAKIVKGRKSAIFFTFLIASTLFLDDYFSIITVSAVMRVVLDRNQVSKPKSAYVIHTMAGSMCILIPISSWAAVVITQIGDCGIKKPFNVFLGAISYNIYPVLCFLLILFTTFSGIDVGGMTTYEENAIKGESANDGSVMVIREETKESEMGDGKVLDLVLPILVLIFFSVLFMVYLGGGFSGKKPIQQIFADSDTGQAITYASFVTLLFSLVLYVPRKLMTFLEFMEETKQGMKSMIDTFLILVLAWTIGGVSGSLLKTGEYVGDFIVKCSLPLAIVPTVIFLVGALLTFALGTTWAGFSRADPHRLQHLQADGHPIARAVHLGLSVRIRLWRQHLADLRQHGARELLHSLPVHYPRQDGGRVRHHRGHSVPRGVHHHGHHRWQPPALHGNSHRARVGPVRHLVDSSEDELA